MLTHERRQVRQLVDVVTGDDGVDLDLHPQLAGSLPACDGAVEGALDAAEGVVGGGGGAVEREGDDVDAVVLQARQGVLVELVRARGGHGHVQPGGRAVGGELGEVGALEAVAAGDDEDNGWLAEGGCLVHEGLGLVGGELTGVTQWAGLGAAVTAGELAGAGGLPGHEHGAHRGVVTLDAHGSGAALRARGRRVSRLGPVGRGGVRRAGRACIQVGDTVCGGEWGLGHGPSLGNSSFEWRHWRYHCSFDAGSAGT